MKVAVVASSPGEPVPRRALITTCLIFATTIQALDSTIANLALPYMQGSLGATIDQVAWVLTSYIIATAIMTAPMGWLASRFGRKQLLIVCLAGFATFSLMCAMAQSLQQIVIFRLVQGMFGAGLVPLAQSVLLDIYPVEQRGSAMAVWGMGLMIGPIIGPPLGGLLTEYYHWRLVFVVSLPFALMAILGLLVLLPRSVPQASLRFDWLGFAVLAIAVASFQLMLDRGQTEDWFDSTQIRIAAVLAGLGFFLFVVHIATADAPFISPALFLDRNYVTATFMLFCFGVVLISSNALAAPWLQTVSRYPVGDAGMLLAPRGLASMFGMMLVGKLSRHVDQRVMVAAGLLCTAWSFWDMTSWTPDVAPDWVTWVMSVQGFGLGMTFIPLQVIAFTTLAPALRTQGSAVINLFRNIGAALGVSMVAAILVSHGQVLHEQIGAAITPFHRMLNHHPTLERLLDTDTARGAAFLDRMVTAEATVIAYLNDFRLLLAVTLLTLCLVPLIRRPAPGAA
ncbi:MAG: DHA2 family efflux MFS transporter permease subunit [Acetobacteraceae bacterium]